MLTRCACNVNVARAEDDIDGYITLDIELMVCASFGHAIPLAANTGRGILNLCVSDAGKEMLLNSTGFIPHLIHALLLDPEHPRKDTEQAVKSVVQRDIAECIQQLSLFPPGLQALRAASGVIDALDAVVEQAWTEEAKDCARGALMQLTDRRKKPIVDGNALHIMVSYQWAVQEVMKRVVSELQRRDYLVWFDRKSRVALASILRSGDALALTHPAAFTQWSV